MWAYSDGSALELSPLEDLDRVALAQMDDRLLPARLRTENAAAALRLRANLDDVHALDLDVEELLDGLAHLRLVCVLVHLERVLVLRDLLVALLRDHRTDQHLAWMQAHDALPCTASSAAWLTSSERAHTTCATSSSDGTVTSTRSRLRNDFETLSSSGVTITTVGVDAPHFESSSDAPFVEGVSNGFGSSSASVPACAWSESAERSAAFKAFLFTFTEKSRGVGGNATPPALNCGARIVPWRARPVPFWRHGLARPPETSPRLLVAKVPARRAFNSARTASCTRCGLTSAAYTASSSVISFDFLPVPSSSGAEALIRVPPRSRWSGPGRRPSRAADSSRRRPRARSGPGP